MGYGGYGPYGPCPPGYGVGPGPVRPSHGNTFALIIVLFILLIIIGATFVKY
ncbi:YjcZ family sporulation protein [Paenisporosarcina antarctica]|uniref:YjcZ family sporulation protein n=1 Tax=Paenisporosarcina antarctica TaxID=417367 RepID=A0A4P6ZY19_9BACL|nr:YjcZ family sporulation protein [Paenisporosarcina antarctica]QBP41204.1 YjcZ family sporulation protein [Paenisporosarcina antarctica]